MTFPDQSSSSRDHDAQPDPEAGQARRREYIGVDPILNDLYRDPYDPLFAARAAGELTGAAIHSSRRWVRVLALVITLLFVASLLGGAVWFSMP